MPAVQPCALLLVVGPEWQVEAVSANLAMVADSKPEAPAKAQPWIVTVFRGSDKTEVPFQVKKKK